MRHCTLWASVSSSGKCYIWTFRGRGPAVVLYFVCTQPLVLLISQELGYEPRWYLISHVVKLEPRARGPAVRPIMSVCIG